MFFLLVTRQVKSSEVGTCGMLKKLSFNNGKPLVSSSFTTWSSKACRPFTHNKNNYKDIGSPWCNPLEGLIRLYGLRQS